MDRFLSVRARNGVAGDPAALPGVYQSRCGAFLVGNLSRSVVGCQERKKADLQASREHANNVKSRPVVSTSQKLNMFMPETVA